MGKACRKIINKLYTGTQNPPNMGNAKAQYNLGFMYYKGQGLPQDFVIAYVWFNMGATNGNENAVKGRDIILEKMIPNQVATAKVSYMP